MAREVLLYMLLGLVLVLVLLLVLIFRKRSGLKDASEAEETEKEPEALIEPETGETGAYAIKDKIMSEVEKKEPEKAEPVKQEPEPPPEPKTSPKVPIVGSVKKFMRPIFSSKEKPEEAPQPEEAPPEPKKKLVIPFTEESEPAYQEDVIEQGIDSEEYHEHVAQEPEPPEEEKVKDELEVIDLEVAKPIKEEKPVPEQPAPQPPATPQPEPKPVIKKPEPRVHAPDFKPPKFLTKQTELKVSAEETLGKTKGGKFMETIDTAELVKDEKAFIKQTISIVGELQLSSKGTDFWYVLFDKFGSAIIRSDNEIKEKKCRITAKVEKTRLGQIYLDVVSFEKAK